MRGRATMSSIKPAWLIFCVTTIVLMAGCIIVPVPHEQWLSPRFHGVVTDTTGLPLKDVKVTLCHYGAEEEKMGLVSTSTDEYGRYSILASRHTVWMTLWFPMVEAVRYGTVIFEHSGYESENIQKASMMGGVNTRYNFDASVTLRKKTPE